jgi:hypothetical protein
MRRCFAELLAPSKLSLLTYHILSVFIDFLALFDEHMNMSLYEESVVQNIDLIGGTGLT